MNLNSEKGLGDAAFLFIFVMAALCMIAGAIKIFSVMVVGVIICAFIALALLLIKKRNKKS